MKKKIFLLCLLLMASSLLTGFSFVDDLDVKKIACQKACKEAEEKCIAKAEKEYADSIEKLEAAKLACRKTNDKCQDKCE